MTTEISGGVPAAVPTQVLAAIKSASHETGSDFDYLLATARRESNLDNKAKSKGSSAAGLFQFIEQTWLSLIKHHGGRHGLSEFAEAISRSQSGRYVVASRETKSAILALREDPEISALMAGEAAVAAKQSLEGTFGREISPGEVYAAHFLGTRGARRLIALNQDDSTARADLAFPDAAKANRDVFYHSDGRAKTIGEVHAWAMGQGASPMIPDRSNVLASEDLSPLSYSATKSVSEYTRANRAQASTSVAHRSASVYVGSVGVTERALPHSPLVLSTGVLEILAALAEPPVTKRQGLN